MDASVNRGDKSSVKTKFQEDMPWLVFGWCMAHKLELYIQDALKMTYFDKVDELVLRICYLYKRLPKKLRELSEIHDLVKESNEFDASDTKPVKAINNRWRAHKIRTLKILLDKYSIYIIHLRSPCTDQGCSEKERSKFKEYLKESQSTKMLVNTTYYIGLLEPVQILFLALQKKEVDAANFANFLLKTKVKFCKLKQKPVELYPSTAYSIQKIAENDTAEALFKGLFKINFFADKFLNLS